MPDARPRAEGASDKAESDQGATVVAARRAALEIHGASGDVLAELLEYLENPYQGLPEKTERLPVKEEPQVEAWRRYLSEADRDGAVAALRGRFPQLSFPVSEGRSQTPEYRAATRRGEFDPASGPGLSLERPELLELALDDGPAGPVPVLVARHRPDFVRLVQALTARNEPETVPPAMGACLVKGLADWERVRAYRARWEKLRGGPAREEDWAAEMATNLAPRKELWQDRLILLSDGPYSALPASEAGLSEGEWRERSLALRLAHESFHYLTLRLAGSIRSHLLDELVADYAGLMAAFGRYDARLALRFLGLENGPAVRPDGRLAVYRGALSDGAVAILARLLVAASRELEALGAPAGEGATSAGRARTLIALAAIGLEGIALPGLPERLAGARDRVGTAS